MEQTKDPIVNCHTHIFTIDHVPNKFGKCFLPWPLYHVVTINVVKKFYNNFTSRGSNRYKSFQHRVQKLKFWVYRILKFTIILWVLFSIIVFVIKWLFRILSNFLTIDSLFSKEVTQLYYRYLTMARYSTKYKTQSKIYEYLTKNYPEGTKQVVLSMDMDFMEAGQAKISYMEQIEQLRQLGRSKKDLLPFVFADPRRINATKDLKERFNYFNYLKSYLEKSHFAGIKLYPALGYYPFDKDLIELYKFAQEYEIPIMSHCIKGTVFYRGKKEYKWNEHEILKYPTKGKVMKSIPLPQKDNFDYTTNFTHPLNFECLLNPDLLSEYLGEEIDLGKLKICIAHFGGTEEWDKYRKDAFNNYNNNISPSTKEGYLNSRFKNTLNFSNKRTIWWNASWLSVIYDLIVKYDNVYSDVSFILYNEELFPMLKYLLNDAKVKERILFGTDFYVVSQKGLDKDLYQRLRSYLGEELFNQIAVDNPKTYLQTKL